MQKCAHEGEGPTKCCLDALRENEKLQNPQIRLVRIDGRVEFEGEPYKLEPITRGNETIGRFWQIKGKLVNAIKALGRNRGERLDLLDPESDDIARPLLKRTEILIIGQLFGEDKADCLFNQLYGERLKRE